MIEGRYSEMPDLPSGCAFCGAFDISPTILVEVDGPGQLESCLMHPECCPPGWVRESDDSVPVPTWAS